MAVFLELKKRAISTRVSFRKSVMFPCVSSKCASLVWALEPPKLVYVLGSSFQSLPPFFDKLKCFQPPPASYNIDSPRNER